MKLLLTGKFDPEYNRTRIIIKGLQELGIDLKIMPYSRKKKVDRKHLKAEINRSDWVFMPCFTHTDVPFIKNISNKPVLFDPLISRYLSKVFDYKTVSRYSPRAYKNYLKDSRSLSKADLIIADTEMHKKYYEQKFGIPGEKIKVVPVGVITEDFFPIGKKSPKSSMITAGFYGSFIPLHGIEVIINAAEILRENDNIRFKIAGQGILFQKMKKMAETKKLNNIFFPGYIPYPSLNLEINSYDIALGIFGKSRKAGMVIPNKLFHYASCNKPLITMESEGVKEIFTHGENIHLCTPEGDALAEAILTLQNEKYRITIGNKAGKLIRENYNEIKTAGRLIEFLK